MCSLQGDLPFTIVDIKVVSLLLSTTINHSCCHDEDANLYQLDMRQRDALEVGIKKDWWQGANTFLRFAFITTSKRLVIFYSSALPIALESGNKSNEKKKRKQTTQPQQRCEYQCWSQWWSILVEDHLARLAMTANEDRRIFEGLTRWYVTKVSKTSSKRPRAGHPLLDFFVWRDSTLWRW